MHYSLLSTFQGANDNWTFKLNHAHDTILNKDQYLMKIAQYNFDWSIPSIQWNITAICRDESSEQLRTEEGVGDVAMTARKGVYLQKTVYRSKWEIKVSSRVVTS